MATDSITLFPQSAATPADVQGFIRAGEVFHRGDRVMLTHRPSKSRLFGTLGGVFGVGRIRGFEVEGVPFGIRAATYPMGKPSDATYGLALVERGDEALAAAKAWRDRQNDGNADSTAWEDLSEAAQEAYVSAYVHSLAHA